MPISVNVSRLEFYDPYLYDNIINLVEKYQLELAQLKLEITESACIDDHQQLLHELQKLRKYGFQVLLDDFGSGYSSLGMLKDIPVDTLKLDMHFLSEDNLCGKGSIILASIIQMVRELHISTIAEGIETQKQRDFVKKSGCISGQGYYYAKPLPMEEFYPCYQQQICK